MCTSNFERKMSNFFQRQVDGRRRFWIVFGLFLQTQAPRWNVRMKFVVHLLNLPHSAPAFYLVVGSANMFQWSYNFSNFSLSYKFSLWWNFLVFRRIKQPLTVLHPMRMSQIATEGTGVFTPEEDFYLPPEELWSNLQRTLRIFAVSFLQQWWILIWICSLMRSYAKSQLTC